MLSYVRIEEGHDHFSREISGWSMYGDYYETKERLIDRGIRKTISIKIPKPTLEFVE